MSPQRRTTRRGFLVLGVAVIAGAGFVKLRGSEPRELTSHVGAALDTDSMREVGRAYLDTRPDEDDEGRLVELLEARPEWRSVKSAEDARRALARASRADFAAGRIVDVRGWYLSEAEGRACALATLA